MAAHSAAGRPFGRGVPGRRGWRSPAVADPRRSPPQPQSARPHPRTPSPQHTGVSVRARGRERRHRAAGPRHERPKATVQFVCEVPSSRAMGTPYPLLTPRRPEEHEALGATPFPAMRHAPTRQSSGGGSNFLFPGPTPAHGARALRRSRVQPHSSRSQPPPQARRQWAVCMRHPGAHLPTSARRRLSRSPAPASKPAPATAALRARLASASAAACRHTTCRRPRRAGAARWMVRPHAPTSTPRRYALSSTYPPQPPPMRAPRRVPLLPVLAPAPVRPPRAIHRRTSTG